MNAYYFLPLGPKAASGVNVIDEVVDTLTDVASITSVLKRGP